MTSSLFGGYLGLFSGVNVNFSDGIPTPSEGNGFEMSSKICLDFGFPSTD